MKFPEGVVTALRDGQILTIRAGTRPHRFIGIWVVVVATTELVPRGGAALAGGCRLR